MRMSLRKLTLLQFAFFIVVSAFGQGKHQPDPAVNVHPLQEVELLNVVNLSEVKDDWMANMKNTRKVHTPGVDVNKDRYLELKEEANQMREKLGEIAAQRAQKTSGAVPTVGTQFFGNSFDGSIPNDNGIAISNGGKIVSVTNSRIYIYDEMGGSPLQWSTLHSFVGNSYSSMKFDPVVTYDPNNDKFIVVFLAGASSSTSRVVVAFSQTNDPTGTWNVYGLDGDVTGGVWTDFEQIGISDTELFITGNLFSSFSEGSAVWQIELADGYAGTTLTTQVYDTPYFSLHPVEGALSTYGDKFYLIRNANFGPSNQIWVHVITNTIAAGGTLNAPVSFNMSTSYTVSPDADQPSGTPLSTNDNRIQTSYFENGRMQFAFNSGAGGKSGIFYGTGIISGLDIAFSSFSGILISDPSYDLAYPGVTYAGTQGITGENATFVMCNHSSSSAAPGNGAIYIDENGTVGDFLVLRTGLGSMGGGSSAYRWGDYADIAPRVNNPGEAWVGGSYGQSSGANATYISQIFTPTPTASEPVVTEPSSEIKIYPNPVTDFVKFEFDVPSTQMYTVEVWDLTGKKLKTLFYDKLKEGEAMVTFNTTHLTSGTYFVVVKDENTAVYNEKFVVTH